jgi:ABC-type multidrug transport system fused ATPase/permease subunit
MKLIISEKQLQQLVKMHAKSQELSEEGEEGAPEAGTSSDGDKKTGMPKWESGINRGPANQIAVTRWKDIDGTTPARGKANTLWEQLNKSEMVKLSKYVYKEDDDENFFVNVGKGEFSEALLDLRSFMFSGWGLASQIIVGVVGSEVGAPVALAAIDAAIVLNDFYLFNQQGMSYIPPSTIKGSWERFKWALSNNPDFLRVVEDVIFLATLGVVRGATNVVKFFTKNNKGFAGFMQMLKGVWAKVEKGINFVPGKFGSWLKQRSNLAKKSIEYFENMASSNTKIGRAVGRSPKAFYMSAVTTLGFEVGLRTLSFILSLNKPIDPQKIDDVVIKTKGETIQKMVYEKEKLLTNKNGVADEFYKVIKTYPKYKNLSRSEFSLTNQKKDNETIFIISGVKYYININMEIQKI